MSGPGAPLHSVDGSEIAVGIGPFIPNGHPVVLEPPGVAVPLVGSAGGFLYYRYVGCATGTCAVTSSPWLSTGFGCVLGSLLYTVLRPGRGKRQDGNGAE